MTRLAMLSLAALGMGFAGAPGLAQDAELPEPPGNYPTRPIELVVVYPAGGGMDTTARILSNHAERILGHEFRVVNREGGGGLVGHTFLAKEAPADGYTLGVLAMGNLVADIAYRGGDFSVEDFDPIAFINFDPIVLMSRGPSFEEIIAQAEAEPGSVRVGVIPNSVTATAVDVVEEQKGVQFTRVPFQGGGPRLTALLNGTIDLNSSYYVEAEQYIESGEVQPIAVANTEPYFGDETVPTYPELGLDVQSNVIGAARFVALPTGVDEEIRSYLAEALQAVLEDEQTQEAYAEQGLVVAHEGPEETQEILANSMAAATTEE